MYKIKWTYNPMMQCILGKWFGWQIVLDAFNNQNYYSYTKPFTQNKSNFNKLVKHIKNNRI